MANVPPGRLAVCRRRGKDGGPYLEPQAAQAGPKRLKAGRVHPCSDGVAIVRLAPRVGCQTSSSRNRLIIVFMLSVHPPIRALSKSSVSRTSGSAGRSWRRSRSFRSNDRWPWRRHFWARDWRLPERPASFHEIASSRAREIRLDLGQSGARAVSYAGKIR